MHDDIPALGLPLEAESPLRIRLGTHLITAEPVYWLPEDTRFPAAANLAVVGAGRTGNTQMLFSAAIQLLRQKEQAGEPLGLLLVDGLEDYNDSRGNFLELTEARTLRLHKLPFHPLRLSGLEQKPQLHTQTAMVFADTLARSYGLSPPGKEHPGTVRHRRLRFRWHHLRSPDLEPEGTQSGGCVRSIPGPSPGPAQRNRGSHFGQLVHHGAV